MYPRLGTPVLEFKVFFPKKLDCIHKQVILQPWCVGLLKETSVEICGVLQFLLDAKQVCVGSCELASERASHSLMHRFLDRPPLVFQGCWSLLENIRWSWRACNRLCPLYSSSLDCLLGLDLIKRQDIQSNLASRTSSLNENESSAALASKNADEILEPPRIVGTNSCSNFKRFVIIHWY